MAYRWSAWTFAPVFVFALVPASLSCSSPASGPASTGGSGSSPILVEAASFNGFCNWSSAEAVAQDDAGDGLHVGPLRVYWNQAPAHGSTAFPQGTLILKSSEEADPTKHTIFAMAKVGGGYNSDGAVNWEWFSLQENADCTVSLLWNTVPSSTDTYAGQPIGDCNGCHTLAKANDYVWDEALQLSNF